MILPSADAKTLQQVENRVRELEAKWTRFAADSELMQLNATAGAPNFVSKDTVTLLRAMVRGFDLSQGAFNPSLLSSMNEIGYTQSLTKTKEAASVFDDRRIHRNSLDITIQDAFVQIPADMALDAGGIGKGLTADVIGRELEQSGINDYLINAGGDLFANGKSPEGQAWTISIENPLDASESIARVGLERGGLATSSQLKRRFNDRGHLLNPFDIQKSNDLVSVTVIAGSGADAEALTKVPFVHENWSEIIENSKAVALAVYANGSTIETEGWNKFNVNY